MHLLWINLKCYVIITVTTSLWSISCCWLSVVSCQYLLMWSFTSGFPKTTPQSSCFSSSASPLPARTARGSGRPPVPVCSSEVRRCTRCGKGRPAYTSRSRWKEGQSREQSVREGREVGRLISNLKYVNKLNINPHREGCGLVWV